MNPCSLEIGQQVYWTDPAEEDGDEHSSGVWTVTRTGTEDFSKTELREMGKDGRDEIIVFCKNDAGGELECFAHELKKLPKNAITFDPRKPHRKLPLPNGTQHEEIALN